MERFNLHYDRYEIHDPQISTHLFHGQKITKIRIKPENLVEETQHMEEKRKHQMK